MLRRASLSFLGRSMAHSRGAVAAMDLVHPVCAIKAEFLHVLRLSFGCMQVCCNTITWKEVVPRNVRKLVVPTDTCSIEEPTFNRAIEKRRDSIWLSEAFSSTGLIIPLLGGENLIMDGKPALLPSSSFLTQELMGKLIPIFLGLDDEANKPVFAVDISGTNSTVDTTTFSWLQGMEWVDLRKYGSQLSMHDAGLLAYARGMVEWLSKNKYCSQCGEKLEVKEGGHSLKCTSTNCGSSIYPRLDPAVIVLVTCGKYVLLGRQSRWDPGRYSLLAGFVEVGETLERAALREVEEETGVKLKTESLRYVASQPWPFPSSLMVGFCGEAEDASIVDTVSPDNCFEIIYAGKLGLQIVSERERLQKIEVDTTELENAQWIHRDFLTAVLQGMKLPGRTVINLPGKHAIAHSLMKQWVSQREDQHWEGSNVPTVEISEGVFKYVLIQIGDEDRNRKLIVRGDQAKKYHAEIFMEVKEQLRKIGLVSKPLGGGRIQHNVEEQTIHVYGYSQAYGRANHEVTFALLQIWFPFYKITFSWDGY